MNAPAIVWFRNDLRIADNPALTAAARTGAPLVALYILDDAAPANGARRGGALVVAPLSRGAVSGSRGVQLALVAGALDIPFEQIIAETGASAVFWNRLYQPWAIRRDEEIIAQMRDDGVNAIVFTRSCCLSRRRFAPSRARASGRSHLLAGRPPRRRRNCRCQRPKRCARRQFRPTATTSTLGGCCRRTQTGRAACARPGLSARPGGPRRVRISRVTMSSTTRPNATSSDDVRGSPRICTSAAAPRDVWRAIDEPASIGGELRELGWRVSPSLAHRPLGLARTSARQKLRELSLSRRRARARRLNGQTGYPLVDAAMRELWITGWMPDRARMVSASFLVKHLLIDWREGEAWFGTRWSTRMSAAIPPTGNGSRAGRRCRTLFSGFQSDPAGREIRSGWRLCPPLRAGTRAARRPLHPSPLGGARGGLVRRGH